MAKARTRRPKDEAIAEARKALGKRDPRKAVPTRKVRGSRVGSD